MSAKKKPTRKRVMRRAPRKATKQSVPRKGAANPGKVGSKSVQAKSTTKKAADAAAPKSKARPRAVAQAKAAADEKPLDEPVAEPVAALPRKRSKASIPLEELPTEELWSVYRKEAANARKTGSKEQLDRLRNILIERHYPLVRYIAERLLQTLPKSIELDDLISAGLFGLMDAIRGFDASRGIKFKTYCSTRIRGAILDQLRSQDWVPRLVRLKASKIERALQRLTAEYGREPTHAELARSLEMEHDDLVREIQESRAKTMFSLSEKWEDDDGSVEKVEVLEDKTAIDPVHELNRRDLMHYITRALTHKERFIIEQYYEYGHTMREIGEMLALTESRVCQIHSNVMGRLKGLLGQRSGSLMS